MLSTIKSQPRATETVIVVLTPDEQDALHYAAQYLVGFGRFVGVLEPTRYPLSDLRDVAKALTDLHAQARSAAAAEGAAAA